MQYIFSTRSARLGQRWRRIVPLIMLTHILISMDHINLSFALPGMERSLAIGATLVGIAAGVLSCGALLAQVPAGYWVAKWGPRRLVTLALLSWGVLALANSGVQNATQLLIVRFLLGMIDGAMGPALLVLLSRWFPLEERARANTYWMFCIPLTSLALKPLVGLLLLYMNWRMLFVIEGIGPLLWAPLWFFLVADEPGKARWIGVEEQEELEHKFARDKARMAGTRKQNWREVLKLGSVWALGIASLLGALGARGMNFWLPVVITGVTHQRSSTVGLIAVLPSLAGMVGLYINSRHSDRSKERKRHAGVPHLLAGFALLAAGILVVVNRNMSIGSLVIAEGCMLAAGGVFWTLPALLLSSESLGAGVGMIGSISSVGGIVGPLFMGWIMTIKEGVHGISLLMAFVGLTQLISGYIILSLRVEKQPEPAGQDALLTYAPTRSGQEESAIR
ncbi:MFS transporter [Ktedonobacter robiniae]|uniref:MFS transporter n=1 Tax=Ktedonobacter robiniae TaxID=2778365 RepID=A0ABQ3UGT0_9CHLR|nr:MFS transporter [Ktedonobacter robiniae]GHO51915.1 MFS transporter [Ktedonobacter robiniae]